MTDIIELKRIATQVRRDIIRMVGGASSGHPGGSLGCADVMTALYFGHMDLNPEQFDRKGGNEDMFFYLKKAYNLFVEQKQFEELNCF